jgi:metal-responsive CopG/Arc/MetJ family transcriptional regulator
MDDVRVVRLPRDLIERVDERASDELRSRSNLVRLFVVEGLQRREAADTVDQRED